MSSQKTAFANHAMHSCIPPEENFSQNITFNFNPKDCITWQNLSKFDNPIKDFISQNYKLFDKCKNCIIKCRPEISKLGRVHFHGTMKILNISFYITDLQRLMLNGAIEMDTIENPMTWDLYCRKQQEIMGYLCQENDVKYIYENKQYEGREYDSFRRS